jgi:hypothetical protein
MFVGTDILSELASLSEPCKTDLADCIEEEALLLALDANVVAQGLTGMVTVDKNKCLSFEGETEICRDGMRADSNYVGDDNDVYTTGAPAQAPSSYSAASGRPNLIFIILCIWFTLKTLF